MNPSRQGPFNLETLEQLAFERSKIWSNTINRIHKLDNDCDLALSDISDKFQHDWNDDLDKDDNSALDLSKEADELDIFDDEDMLQDITNRSRAIEKLRRAPDMNAMEDNDDDDDDDDANSIQQLFDQTMPVLNEHKRQWKEAGLERILNTFDAQKIEEKVGGWLRRNNSKNGSFTICCTPSTHGSAAGKIDSDTESMHSVDTARYILSSRKNKRSGVSVGGRGISSSTTKMTIKTFRLVQSKHGPFSEKYPTCASAAAHDEAHINELRCRRAKRCRAAGGADNSTELLRLAPESHSIQRRRKQLRKRRSSAATHSSNNSYSSNSSSSSSDECVGVCCGRRRELFRERLRCHSLRCANSYYRHHKQQQQRHSFSSSSSSFQSTRSVRHFNQKLKLLRRDHVATLASNDLRPCKRESDCRCCNDAKLCKEIRHLADTSTEDWLVENCDTPKKLSPFRRTEQRKRINTPTFTKTAAIDMNFQQQKQYKQKQQHNKKDREQQRQEHQLQHQFPQQQLVEVSKPKSTKKESTQEKHKKNKNLKQIPENDVIQIDKKLLKKIKTQEKHKKNKNLKQIPENDVIQIDKKLLKKIKTKQFDSVDVISSADTTAKPIKSHENISTEPTKTKLAESKDKIKSKKTKYSLKSDADTPPMSNSDDFERELQLAIEFSKKTFEQEQQKKNQEKNDDMDNINSSPEMSLKPQPKSLKLRKLAKMSRSQSQTNSLDSEDTFFAHSRNICNSTAMAHDATAAQRQFSNEQNTKDKTIQKPEAQKNIKRAPAVSTTNRNGGDSSPSISASSSSTTCTASTSAASQINAAKDDNDCTIVSSTTDDRQQKQHHTYKGILLYTPEQRTLVPTQSFINGYFSITEEHLSTIIGAKPARKFLKYYIGRRRFDSNSTIYFLPPPVDAAVDPNADTDSDEDALECVGRVGELYESVNKG